MIDIEKLVKLGIDTAPIRKEHGGSPFILRPSTLEIQDLERLMPAPNRTTQNIQIHEVDSFTRYVNEHKNADTRVFASIQESGATFMGVIDFTGKDSPSWCSHRVVYRCPHSKEWLTWIGMDRKPMNQRQFAEFIEDNLTDIVTPPGADMLEMAKTLVSRSSVNFKSGVRLDNGNEQLIYEETSDAKAGEKGDMVIPTGFSLGVAPFQGMSLYSVNARMKYRIENGRLTFTYELIKPHRVIQDACQGILTTIKEQTDIAPFVGSI